MPSSLPCRGPADSLLAFQSRWPVVFVPGLKRGGYKVPGTDKVHFCQLLLFVRWLIQMRSRRWRTGGSLQHGLREVCSLVVMFASRELYLEHARWKWRNDGNCHADWQARVSTRSYCTS